jgi:hypothetical protein
MKSLLAFILCLVFVAISGIVPAVGSETPYVATDKEELYGTWVNMDYGGFGYSQKTIIYPDGKIEYFNSTDQKIATARYLITRKWSDPEGNIWYKLHFVGSWGQEGFTLSKTSNSGKTREFVFDNFEYPTKIDPEHFRYRIYYRK